jgi:hypothetical protein
MTRWLGVVKSEGGKGHGGSATLLAISGCGVGKRARTTFADRSPTTRALDEEDDNHRCDDEEDY